MKKSKRLHQAPPPEIGALGREIQSLASIVVLETVENLVKAVLDLHERLEVLELKEREETELLNREFAFLDKRPSVKPEV